jgi:hypothetical protein
MTVLKFAAAAAPAAADVVVAGAEDSGQETDQHALVHIVVPLPEQAILLTQRPLLQIAPRKECAGRRRIPRHSSGNHTQGCPDMPRRHHVDNQVRVHMQNLGNTAQRLQTQVTGRQALNRNLIATVMCMPTSSAT